MRSLLAAALVAVATAASAQVPVTPHPEHERMLATGDARAVANKRLVYAFWREVFEARHMDLAPKYMAEGYIQHNPNVPTGRAAFVQFFSSRVKAREIADHVKSPLVAIVAEGDLVMLAFAREGPDPKDPAKKFTTTWFDLFRIENGKIAEHWDPAQKL